MIILTKRLFISIPVPEAIAEKISEVANEIKEKAFKLKWVSSCNYHITLKFLGGVPVDNIGVIEDVLGRVIADIGISPFKVTCKGAGAFPGFKNPVVLWVGIEDEKASINSVAMKIEDGLFEIGYTKEKRDFHAHVTIARIRRQVNKISGLKELAEGYKEFSFGEFTVNSVKLMESILKPEGTGYSCVKDFPFTRCK